jgi:uncharacterized hydrophobic protein (TIGR00271 family)
VLDRLRENGLDDDSFAIVSDIKSATTPNRDDLSEQFVDRPEGDLGVSLPELRERAFDLQPERRSFVALAALSAAVATAGLLLNSAIIIVGAMVIAPFAGASLSTSVGAVLDENPVVVRSVGSQLLGLAVGFVAALAVAGLVRELYFVPPSLAVSRIAVVQQFVTPSLLSLTVAICAGAAGAIALATDLPVSVAGVAIAAAIIPSVATAAVGVVWMLPLVVVGALVLLAMNIVSINISAYLALVALGYRSSLVDCLRENFEFSARTTMYALVALGFVAAVVFTSAATYQHVSFARQTNRAVEEVLSRGEYSELELLDVSLDYAAFGVKRPVQTVTVTVGRTEDENFPLLAERIQAGISSTTGEPVEVKVRFIDSQVASPTTLITAPDGPDASSSNDARGVHVPDSSLPPTIPSPRLRGVSRIYMGT